MNTITRLSRLGTVLGGLALAAVPAAADEIYVDDDAPPGGNGRNWTSPYRFLQDALNEAANNFVPDTILVGQGTYYPDQFEGGPPQGTNDPNSSFDLFAEVVIEGGYEGYGASNPGARNITEFETILNGDVDDNQILDDGNSLHVVTAVTTGGLIDQETILDGVTITMGYANDTKGGGILIEAARPIIQRCTVTHNTSMPSSMGRGGGIAFIGTPPGPEPNDVAQARHCTITENVASHYGGGVYVESPKVDTVAAIVDCTITANQANGNGFTNGDGLAAFTMQTIGDPVQFDVYAVNCIFQDNWATFSGGGIGIRNESRVGTPINWFATNCLFVGNGRSPGSQDDTRLGGAMYNVSGDAQVINCTIVDNVCRESGGSGGGYYQGQFDRAVSGQIVNDILWANAAASGSQIHMATGDLTVDHSDVEGGLQGVGGSIPVWTANIEIDPAFFHAAGGNYRLDPAVPSPCLNVGDQNATPSDRFDVNENGQTMNEKTPDLDGGVRVLNNHVDMGAYESDEVPCPDTNGDFVVDVLDLLIVLGDWGPCPGCPADVNGDEVVDVLDLLAVLVGWGPCGAADPDSAPQGVLDCIAKYGYDPEKLAGCLETMILTAGH